MISELPGTTNGAAWVPDGKVLLAGNYFDRAGLYEVSERGGELKERLILRERATSTTSTSCPMVEVC